MSDQEGDNYRDIKQEEMELEFQETPSNIELGLTLLLNYSQTGQKNK